MFSLLSIRNEHEDFRIDLSTLRHNVVRWTRIVRLLFVFFCMNYFRGGYVGKGGWGSQKWEIYGRVFHNVTFLFLRTGLLAMVYHTSE